MIFGLFKSKAHPHKRDDDSVWMTDDDRLRGVIAEAERRIKRGERVSIGACDSKTANALKYSLGTVAVEILEPEELVPDRLRAIANEAPVFALFLVGLFSDPDYEEKLLTQCKDFSCKIQLHVHYSFTELVGEGIIEPSVEKLLRGLGAKEGKAITDTRGTTGVNTGRMLSKSIAKARHKKAQ